MDEVGINVLGRVKGSLGGVFDLFLHSVDVPLIIGMIRFKSIDLRMDHGITVGSRHPDGVLDLGSQAVRPLAAIVTDNTFGEHDVFPESERLPQIAGDAIRGALKRVLERLYATLVRCPPEDRFTVMLTELLPAAMRSKTVNRMKSAMERRSSSACCKMRPYSCSESRILKFRPFIFLIIGVSALRLRSIMYGGAKIK